MFDDLRTESCTTRAKQEGTKVYEGAKQTYLTYQTYPTH
jgi:hypothetical protein